MSLSLPLIPHKLESLTFLTVLDLWDTGLHSFSLKCYDSNMAVRGDDMFCFFSSTGIKNRLECREVNLGPYLALNGSLKLSLGDGWTHTRTTHALTQTAGCLKSSQDRALITHHSFFCSRFLQPNSARLLLHYNWIVSDILPQSAFISSPSNACRHSNALCFLASSHSDSDIG